VVREKLGGEGSDMEMFCSSSEKAISRVVSDTRGHLRPVIRFQVFSSHVGTDPSAPLL
jgi:hypothetical protein